MGLTSVSAIRSALGGIFRALRTYPVMRDVCQHMDEVAPNALLLNYVNPMAMNCWAVDKACGRPVVGLCHSVQGTSEMLASWIGVPIEAVRFRCAGINHQAFFSNSAAKPKTCTRAFERRLSDQKLSDQSRCAPT